MEYKVKNSRSKVNPWFLTTLFLIPLVNIYVWFSSNRVLESVGVPLRLSILGFGMLTILGMLVVYWKPINMFTCVAILATITFLTVFVLMGLGDDLQGSGEFLLLEQAAAYLLFMTFVQIPSFAAALVDRNFV